MLQSRLLLAAAVICLSTHAATLRIDQSNTVTPNFGTTVDWGSPGGTGQQFIPQLPGVDFVTLALSEVSGHAVSVLVNLREGVMTGPVKGSTFSVMLPPAFGGDSFELVDFRFPETVSLTPGSQYVFEISTSPGSNVFIWGNQLPMQTGQAVVDGPYPCCDFYFVEGMIETTVVPDPATVFTCGTALLLFTATYRRRMPG